MNVRRGVSVIGTVAGSRIGSSLSSSESISSFVLSAGEARRLDDVEGEALSRGDGKSWSECEERGVGVVGVAGVGERDGG